MVESFLEHTPPVLRDLSAAADNDDWKKVSEICHRLKASYGTLTVSVLAEDVVALEREYETLSKDDRIKILNRILAISEKVLESLSKEDFQNLE